MPMIIPTVSNDDLDKDDISNEGDDGRPMKTSLIELTLEPRAIISIIDFTSLSCDRFVRNLLSYLCPQMLVFIKGTPEKAQALSLKCHGIRSSGNLMDEDLLMSYNDDLDCHQLGKFKKEACVFCPVAGENVKINDLTESIEVELDDGVSQHLKQFRNIKNYKLTSIEGKIAISKDSNVIYLNFELINCKKQKNVNN